MASRQHDNNCINCNNRHEEMTCKPCEKCIDQRTKEVPFPGWEPKALDC